MTKELRELLKEIVEVSKEKWLAGCYVGNVFQDEKERCKAELFHYLSEIDKAEIEALQEFYFKRYPHE